MCQKSRCGRQDSQDVHASGPGYAATGESLDDTTRARPSVCNQALSAEAGVKPNTIEGTPYNELAINARLGKSSEMRRADSEALEEHNTSSPSFKL